MRPARVLGLRLWLASLRSGMRQGTEKSRVSNDFPSPDYASLPLVTPLLSSLGAGEGAEMRLMTQGCYSGSTYCLTFAGPPPLRVVVRGRDYATDDEELPIIGDTVVTEADALRIDRVLAYYRAGPLDYLCTTQSDIRVRWHTKGGTKTENWHDASGAVADSALSLSLDSVAQRAKRAP